jgi:hypothetical protein
MTPVRIDMLHLAFVGHGPGRDCIGVIDCSVAARREHFLAGRLGVTCLVGGAALQECWAAVPTPRDAEACQRLRYGVGRPRGVYRRLGPVCSCPRPHLATATAIHLVLTAYWIRRRVAPCPAHANANPALHRRVGLTASPGGLHAPAVCRQPGHLTHGNQLEASHEVLHLLPWLAGSYPQSCGFPRRLPV